MVKCPECKHNLSILKEKIKMKTKDNLNIIAVKHQCLYCERGFISW